MLIDLFTPFVEDAIDGTISHEDEAREPMTNALNDPDLSDLNIMLDTVKNRLVRLRGITGDENDLFARMIYTTTRDYSALTNLQAADRIIDSFTVYINRIETYPVKYPTPEFKAAVYLGMGTAEFWEGVEVNTGDVPDDELPFFLNADLVGYLIGWGGAWWKDQGPEYSNSTDAQAKRIGAGLISAMGISTLRGVK